MRYACGYVDREHAWVACPGTDQEEIMTARPRHPAGAAGERGGIPELGICDACGHAVPEPESEVSVTDYRILVTGSRTWDDEVMIRVEVCEELQRAFMLSMRPVVVHGACPRGADAMASRLADQLKPVVVNEPHPADWDRLGKSAGFRRNEEMARAGAVVCLAFIRDGSRGASHCAE